MNEYIPAAVKSKWSVDWLTVGIAVVASSAVAYFVSTAAAEDAAEEMFVELLARYNYDAAYNARVKAKIEELRKYNASDEYD